MGYTITEFLWLIFIYSFLGWVIETIAGTLKKKHFVNRGFSTGPFCFVYGIAAVIMVIAFRELKQNLLFLFLGCAVLGTMLEWFTGKLLERMNQHKWWDYSGKRWNFDGYICLEYSVLWGILGLFTVKYGEQDFIDLFHLFPKMLGNIVVWIVLIICIFDIATSAAAVQRIRKQEQFVSGKRATTAAVQRWLLFLVGKVEGRIQKAYSLAGKIQNPALSKGKFAEGCGFYKLFWLFLIGSVLGDITETIFCRITAGVWMSRSSLVWGPFSIVWGMAIAAATALLYKDKDKPDRYIFLTGTFLGGVYEYLCSVFTELFFGKVFWDYSEIPFNLGGRINLLYCFFWGIAAVIWIKNLYPHFSSWIEMIPVKTGYLLSAIFISFMSVNIIISACALVRYDMREKDIPPSNAFEKLIDTHFNDQRMEKIYPNAKSK